MARLAHDVEEDVFTTVQRCFAEALELDEDEVELDSRVLDDLGAESLDLLDIVFRLERAFDIRIPRGGLEARAQEGDAPGEVDGRLTAAGAARLQAVMPEVPPAELYEGLKTVELARTFRVATFCRLVQHLRDEG